MGRRVHFIGIGGSGLSAIATVLLERGDLVSGSDRQPSPVTKRLQEAGMTVFIGHRAENVAGADLVVRSSAVRDDNVEVQAARLAQIPVYKRVDFLGQLTAEQRTIAVAGTHGKTTTTAMTAWILHHLGMDPSFVIGGFSNNLGGNAHTGQGDYFVIEADEYDRMFLGLHPFIAIVTSVEHDHPDCFPTPADFHQAFEDFIDRLAPGGSLLASQDDSGAVRLMTRARSQGRRTLSYSIKHPTADLFAANPLPNSLGGFTFDLVRHGIKEKLTVRLQIPGLHNVSNALAAIGAAELLDLPLDRVVEACEAFSGTGRRFELRGVVNGVMVIDDYAHHPTEIRATLAAARSRFPQQRIWAVWQPHTFSRTRELLGAFAKAFADADRVIVTEVFAAREQPPEDGFSGQAAAEAIAREQFAGSDGVFFKAQLPEVEDFLAHSLEPGDVVLVLSAGDADQISTHLLADLAGL